MQQLKFKTSVADPDLDFFFRANNNLFMLAITLTEIVTKKVHDKRKYFKKSILIVTATFHNKIFAGNSQLK